MRCTESFMRENVLEEMRDIQATDEMKQKTVEMLKRLHFDEAGRSILEDESLSTDENGEEDSDGGEGSIFSERTIKRILEGTAPTLDDLTEKEMKGFLRYLAAGKVSHLIQPWNPWWVNPLAKSVSVTKQGTRLVQPLEPAAVNDSSPSAMLTSDELEVDASEVPAPPSKPLLSVVELTKKEPSPFLPVHTAEVIYSYCFTLRYYNGDWRSEPLEATSAFLSVSHVVGQAALPESVGEGLHEALQTVCSPMFKDAGGLAFGLNLFDDCAAVLRLGKACIICALADLHNMLENAKRDMDSELGHGKQKVTGHILELKKPKHPRTSSSSGKPQTGRSKLGTSRQVAGRQGIRKELKQIEAGVRKLFFLMCWINEQVDELFSSLAVLVETEKARTLETLGRATTAGLDGMKDLKPVKERPLLQEMV